MHKQRLYIVILSALGIIATFLPWATVAGFSAAGTVGDGWISFAFFLIAAVIVVLGDKSQPAKGGKLITVIIMSLLSMALGIYEIFSITGAYEGVASPGIGVYMIITAGLFNIIVGLLFSKKGGPAGTPAA